MPKSTPPDEQATVPPEEDTSLLDAFNNPPPPVDEYTPDLNPDIERILAQGGEAGAVEDEELEVDWDPTANLIPEGDHPARFIKLESTQTGKGIPAGQYVVVLDGWPNFPRKKKVNLRDGNGIERLHGEFVRALGFEMGTNAKGMTVIPRGQINRAAEERGGIPCTVRIKHRAGQDGRIWDDLDRILPAQDIPSLPGLS